MEKVEDPTTLTNLWPTCIAVQTEHHHVGKSLCA